MSHTPLLILSDAITGSSGLGRVARDLSTRIHSHLSDTYRIATLGVGGGALGTSFRFPFPNYSIRNLDTSYAHTSLGLLPIDLPAVWLDFAGVVGDGMQEDDERELATRTGQLRKGAILAIWNASWCGWLGQPSWLPEGHPLRNLLTSVPLQRWLYCPVDGHCPDGTLGVEIAPILEGFDRLLGYTRYGSEVMKRTLAKWAAPYNQSTEDSSAIPNLPHGLDTSIFFPRPRYLARERFFRCLSRGASDFPLEPGTTLLCVNATNTPRKDWGLAFATCAALLSRNQNVFLWGHTDKLEGHWSLSSLARQFGMAERVTLTVDRYSDEDLSWLLGACDVALGIGSGEGMGYPLMEALGCGIPVIHGNYAGGAEFIPKEFLVEPLGYRIEGRWQIQRPVFSPEAVASTVQFALTSEGKTLARLPMHMKWDKLWNAWHAWLANGENSHA